MNKLYFKYINKKNKTNKIVVVLIKIKIIDSTHLIEEMEQRQIKELLIGPPAGRSSIVKIICLNEDPFHP